MPGETLRTETNEAEKSKETVVADAISKVKEKDATDPVISAEWMEGAKKTGKVAGISLGIPILLSWKIAKGLFKFAQKSIEKKGNVGFGASYEIGKEIFSLENKKDKK